ncbi:MAG: PD40 domain-containing protein [Kouleothrix sp.]|nr:PD40 domain-containing protein [Kouleothrix sp.]
MPHAPSSSETLLLRQPTLSADSVAFVYAGDLWVADLSGAHPQRLTAQKGRTMSPLFSPDGRWIAFSGDYDGSLSVYVIPRAGGAPRRLTYHPADDFVRGWTPDGAQILFASARESIALRARRLFTVPLEGGLPAALPMPMAERASYSPDGRRLAYTPYYEAFWSWKRYRGGMTLPIWLLDLDTFAHVEIPHENASDTFPCWLGDAVYFLSDRAGAMNVFRYDLAARAVRQLTFHEDFDVRWLTSGGGRLAYEQGGRLHLLDPGGGQPRALSIVIAADLPHARPRYQRVAPDIETCAISPTGARAVIEARGEILTVPAAKGDIRNLTSTPGAAERDPAWSPDGQSIAYFSDASGEYELVVSDQKGARKRFYPLGKPSFFYRPIWSPDSKLIAYTDKALNLSYLNVESGAIVHVDADSYDHPVRSLSPAWSPDGQWLAYTKRLASHLRAVFLYELSSGRIHQVSDGMSDAISACFSRDGKLLFFAASVNFGLNTGWLDMSSYERPVSRSIYVAVLRKTDPSPLAPESDEEPPPGGKPALPEGVAAATGDQQPAAPPAEQPGAQPAAPLQIDLDDLDQRIVALPVPPGDYHRLQVAEGKLFYLESTPERWVDPEIAMTVNNLHAYDTKERKSEAFAERVRDYWVSADGKKLLYQAGDSPSYAIVAADKRPKPEDGRLNLDGAEILVDPRAEWRQIFREAFRIHRDYFYDPEMHGLDWAATYEKYLTFLPHVGHRDDLNYLLAELSGELVAGHAYVGLGDIPAPEPVSVGLLGADYEIVDGAYRIRRIYPGLNWHPELRAPLTEPGVNIEAGEYILAVNGRPLRAPTSIYSLFEQTADRITELRVGPTADDADARSVTVRPIADEIALRHWSWVEQNRRTVEALSGGRVGYIYMADTALSGYEAFNRYYFSQLDKQALVLDERFNGGGSVADYVVDLLNRPLLSYWATREGRTFTTPNASIFGPKAMIVNELAGSGGDALPLFFRRRGLGTIVGKRTWGGLIGIYDYPKLIDGGFVTSPRMAIYGPGGEWEVENEGVAPDVEVELTPQSAVEGRDPQLERAVEIVLAELEARPPATAARPAPARRAAAQT